MKWFTPRLRMGLPALKTSKRRISPSRADGAQGREGRCPAPDLSCVHSDGERGSKQMEDWPSASNWNYKGIARHKTPLAKKKKSVESADSDYSTQESAKDDDGGRYAHAQIVVQT